MTDTINVKPSYNEIHAACIFTGNSIMTHCPRIERVIGLTRGGLLPAVVLSHFLDAPMTAVSYSSTEGKGDNKNHANQLPEIKENIILICDDIVDSGYSMKEVAEHYEKQFKNVITFSLFYKPTAVFKPTYRWKEIPTTQTDWVEFPFEQRNVLEIGSR